MSERAKPTSIAQAWEEYERRVVKPNVSPGERVPFKMAFYAGSAMTLGLAMNAPADPKDFQRFMLGLEAECKEHLAELRAMAMKAAH